MMTDSEIAFWAGFGFALVFVILMIMAVDHHVWPRGRP